MKHIILALTAFSLSSASIVQAETFGTGLDIPMEKDPTPWKLAGQRIDTDERVTVLLREGETIDEWTEIIVIKEQPYLPISPGNFRTEMLRALRKKYGRSTVQIEKTLKRDAGSCLFAWSTNEEMELVKAMKRKGQGFAVLTYTCKGQKDRSKAKALFTGILAGVRQTGEKVDTVKGFT